MALSGRCHQEQVSVRIIAGLSEFAAGRGVNSRLCSAERYLKPSLITSYAARPDFLDEVRSQRQIAE